jgi:glycosyltransferase involved in cell wall biosynthesis
MAAGRPLVLAARGEAAALVAATGAGLVVEPEDPHALAAAFRTLAADPARRTELGARGREAAAGFTRAAAVERWAALLADVVAQRARR